MENSKNKETGGISSGDDDDGADNRTGRSESVSDVEAKEKSQKRKRRREAISRSSSSSESGSSSGSGSSSSSSSSGSDSSSSGEEEVEVKRIKIIMPRSSDGTYEEHTLNPTAQPAQSSAPKTTKPERETVPQYLMKHFQIRDELALTQFFRTNFQMIQQQLMGKLVSAAYGKSPIQFSVSGLTTTNAYTTRAFRNGPPVQQHILKKGIEMKHPEWPCLIQKGGGQHQSFFPIELMFIG